MPDFPAVLSAWRHQRELTKLECGLFGALSATIALALLFWLGVQLSMLSLIIQIN